MRGCRSAVLAGGSARRASRPMRRSVRFARRSRRVGSNRCAVLEEVRNAARETGRDISASQRGGDAEYHQFIPGHHDDSAPCRVDQPDRRVSAIRWWVSFPERSNDQLARRRRLHIHSGALRSNPPRCRQLFGANEQGVVRCPTAICSAISPSVCPACHST